MNFLYTRTQMADDMNSGTEGLDPPGRDLDRECGYPFAPTIRTYSRLYEREGYAKRVVDVWPDECWSVRPELYETEDSRVTKFERAWERLNAKVNVWKELHLVDKSCGKGTFALALLGFDDGKDLSAPVEGVNRRGEPSKRRSKKPINLLYISTYSEEHVTILSIEDDQTNPRYGLPRWYNIRVLGTEIDSSSSAQQLSDTLRVHWSRVIHVADNCESSKVFGTPRMKAVLNRLLDIRKTLGGSAEMFWKGAFPGYSFETIPELLGESVMDEESVREQFEEYMDGLKRYLALDGVTAKQLFPQVADPTQHVEQQVAAICACIGVPMRVFMGSESGHLASTQDSINMNKRVSRRQRLFCETDLIRPLVDRLIMVGSLPEPAEGYLISWTDLNTMSDKDKALVALQRSQALMQYVSGQVEAIFPARQFFTLILGLSDEEASAVMDAVEENKGLELTDPLGEAAAERDANLQIKVAKATPKPAMGGSSVKRKPKPQGGGRTGSKPARKPAGRPSGQVQRNRVFDHSFSSQ